VYFVHSPILGAATQYAYAFVSLTNRSFFVKLNKGDAATTVLARARQMAFVWMLKRSMRRFDAHASVAECGHLLTDPLPPPAEKPIFSLSLAAGSDSDGAAPPPGDPAAGDPAAAAAGAKAAAALKKQLLAESKRVTDRPTGLERACVYNRSTEPKIHRVERFSDAEMLWGELDSVLLEVGLQQQNAFDTIRDDLDDFIADREKKEAQSRLAAARADSGGDDTEADYWSVWTRPKEKGLFIKS
jgi:hypothetical protein